MASNYQGNSIVDYLRSTGQASDFSSRSRLAAQRGIAGYQGTAEQNLRLLGLLRTPQNTPAVSPPQQSTPIPNQTTIQSPTQIPNPAQSPTMPTPAAPAAEEAYVTSLTTNSDNLRKRLDDLYKTQKADVDKKLEEANVEKQGFLSKMDPTTRPTYDQEVRVMNNQLSAAEAASGTIQKNFEEKQRLIGELEKLLTQGNAAIEQQRKAPVAQRVLNVRVNNTIQDVAARTGVIEAVLSARDGQIAQAHNIINEAAKTVKANWDDHLTYYNTLLEYNEKDIISLDKEQKAIAEEQANLIKYDIEKVDKTTEYLQKLMIDPDTAQFMADAGVKLTDSIEEIQVKMAAQGKIKEVNDFKLKMAEKGYEFSPIQTAGSKSFQVGGQTMYFIPPAGAATKTTVYDEKNIPGDVRTSVIETLEDAAANRDEELTINDLALLFPEVKLETLQAYMDNFYNYEPKDTDKKWWEFWK